jgi:protein O-mannosyl-transferase
MSKKGQRPVIKAQQKEPVKSSAHNWYSLILVLFTFFIYSNTINNDYALDDDIYTKKNVFVQNGFSSLNDIFAKGSLVGFNGSNDSNYRPLALLNFMIETSIFGNNPHWNHFFNILFFCLTIYVLFKLLKKLFPEVNPVIPFLITFLYAVHPIHTEVVANIKSRDEILGFLFGLMSFSFAIDYYDSRHTKKLILSCVMFFLASLCKENSLTFAFIIPLLLYFFRKATIKQMLVTALPYAGLAGLYMGIRSSVLDSVTFKEQMAVMNNSLMAAQSTADMYATNFMMMGKYIMLLFLPHPLSWDYSFSEFPIVSWTNIKAIGSLLLYIGLGVFTLMRFRQRNIYAFCILFFMTTIFLSSNLVVKIGSSFAERFLYTPSLAFCIALPFLLSKLFRSDLLSKTADNSKVYITISIVLVLFSVKTYSRNKVWENNLTLFTSGLETSPNSARVHYSYASECRTRGEMNPDPNERARLFKEAEKEFKIGLNIYPESDAYYNLGVTYFNMGDNKQALECYRKTIALKKDYTPALNNLGVIHFMDKKYDEAEKYFRLVLQTDTNFGDAYANLGAIFQNKGNFPDAMKFYNSALRKNPRNKNVYQNLNKLYISLGDTVKANEMAKQAEFIK